MNCCVSENQTKLYFHRHNLHMLEDALIHDEGIYEGIYLYICPDDLTG